jgi:hypothetical protein
MAEELERTHFYHAEASVLKGRLDLPLRHEIAPQAFAKVPEVGGYLAQRGRDFRIENVLSYRESYTQVAGNRDSKPGHGWSTLTTSVVEGLNVLDILTADRVVAQIATEYPLIGYVPKISLLGTRFENLRIAGCACKITLDPYLLGAKPENDAPYSSDFGLLERLTGQYENVRRQPNVPQEILARYNQLPLVTETSEQLECSLVTQVESSFPGPCYGHVIDVPGFGRVILAALRLTESDFVPGTEIPRCTEISLTMIEMELGCPISGSISVSTNISNGHTKP